MMMEHHVVRKSLPATATYSTVPTSEQSPAVDVQEDCIDYASARHSLQSHDSLSNQNETVVDARSCIRPSYNEIDSASKFLPPKAFFHKRHQWGRWRRWLWHFGIFVAIFFIIFVSSSLPPGLSVTAAADSAGVFSLLFTYDCMTPPDWSFVGIDLHVITMSYAGVKALDLAWNWVAGRTLQGLLTLLGYRVVTDALLRAAELAPMPYELFVSLALYANKLDVLWQLVKHLGIHGGWRVRAIFIYLFLSTIYLLLFPTLMDASSGYDVTYETAFVWPNGSLSILSELKSVAELTKASNDVQKNSIYEYVSGAAVYHTSENGDQSDYTFYRNDTDAVKAQASDSPHGYWSLDVDRSLVYLQDEALNESWWMALKENPSSLNVRSMKWYGSNQKNYRCSTDAKNYVWGFSHVWITITLGLNSAWLLGLWILWLDCEHNSELVKKGRRLGIWRTIVDLSDAIREDLGNDLSAYSEKDLRHALQKAGGRGLKYYVTEKAGGVGAHDEMREDDGEGNVEKGLDTVVGHVGLSSRASGPVKLEWGKKYA